MLLCVSEACQEAKQAHAEILHIHQEELDNLTSKAPAAWPQSVRQLVELKEKAAASSAEAAAHAEAEAAEAEFDAESERLRGIAAEARARQQHAEAQMYVHTHDSTWLSCGINKLLPHLECLFSTLCAPDHVRICM